MNLFRRIFCHTWPPSLSLPAYLQRIFQKRRFRPSYNFVWQTTPHSSSSQFLVHAPGHGRKAQEKTEDAQVEQRRSRLKRDSGTARVLIFMDTRPITGVKGAVGLRVQRVVIEGWPLLEALLGFRAAAVGKFLVQPRRRWWRGCLRVHPPSNPVSKPSAKGRKARVSTKISAEIPDNLSPRAALV